MNTVGQWLSSATERLRLHADAHSARIDAELLAGEVTGLSRTALFAHPETTLEQDAIKQLDELLNRRCAGEPLAYLTGTREFWSLALQVAPGVLVPRPDTELLVETALQLAPTAPAGPVADLGTGSGAIAIALACELRERPIIAIERHDPAIAVAVVNILKHTPGKVSLVQANWLTALADQSLAMVVANPPYLATDDSHLPCLSYEPANALVSGVQGLDDLQLIAQQCLRAGKPGAIVLLEHGHDQGTAVRLILDQLGYLKINTEQDLAGLERVTHGSLPDRVVMANGINDVAGPRQSG